MALGGWKLARNRGSVTAQLPLAVCMVLAVGILLLGKAEASIFDSARAHFTDWTAPALDVVRGPVAAMQRWAGGISDMFSVYEENLALREQNEALRQWQDVALTLEERLARYQELLNAVPDPDLPSMTARVIGHSNRPFTKTVILNAGADQNVRKGQAVIDHRGLLGRIYVTGENTSWVLPLTDLNSRVPVVIRPSNRRAILSGNNSMSPYLQLDSGEAEVNAGDRIYSTGDGGVLPPELPVGMVVAEDGEWRAALFSDPDLSDLVQIVEYRPEIEPPAEEGLPVSMLQEQDLQTAEDARDQGENALASEVGSQ